MSDSWQTMTKVKLIQTIQTPIINNQMPQIGWLEILAVVIIAILVLGPKEFPIALKKIGSYIGKIKNTFSSFQKEISNATSEIDIDKEFTKKKEVKKEDNKND